MNPVSTLADTGFTQAMTRAEFESRLHAIVNDKLRSPWAIGDAALLADANADFDEVLEQLLTPDVISEPSRANYKSLCRRFPPEKRLFRLSQSHYAVVAKLPDEDAFDWLKQAEDGQLSREALRKLVAADRESIVIECEGVLTADMTIAIDVAVSPALVGARVKVRAKVIAEVVVE